MDGLKRFRLAQSTASEWSEAVEACVGQLAGLDAGVNLAFVYVTDAFAESLDLVVRGLASRTGVPYWVGSTGVAVCATGREYASGPAVVVLAGHVAEEDFALLDGLRGPRDGLPEDVAAWVSRRNAIFGVLHADLRTPDLAATLVRLGASTGGFFVGGVGSSTAANLQVAGDATAGGVSGVLLAGVPVIAGLTQGCRPIGPFRTLTDVRGRFALTLDGRPATQALAEDLGCEGAAPTGGGGLHAALPVPGSDRADYVVRELLGVDSEAGALAIGAPLAEGQRLGFVRRDPEAALVDLGRMLDDLERRRDGRAIRGALYHACVARGARMFGRESVELQAIQRRLGDVPLVGFFAQGEIFHDRLYGYTGVLSLFLE